MNEKALEMRRAYHRAWTKKNPDKVRLYNEKYWTRKAEQATAEQVAAEQKTPKE